MIKLPIAALVVIVGLLGGFYGGYKVGGGGGRRLRADRLDVDLLNIPSAPAQQVAPG